MFSAVAGAASLGCRRAYVFVSDLVTGTSNQTTYMMSSEPLRTISRGVGSAWITPRGEGKTRRFLVRYRAGGREAKIQHAGSFRRRADAVLREQWVSGLIAAGRGTDIPKLLRGQNAQALTVTEAGKRWLRSRIDISAHTVCIHGDSLRRLESLIGETAIDELTPEDVAEAIAALAEKHKPSTVRKSLNVLRQALDHAGLERNPARDRRIRLPRQQRVQIAPPETAHVEAVVRALPPRYRLPVLALDSTGMRISELVGSPGGTWTTTPDAGACGRTRRRRACRAGSTPSTRTSTRPSVPSRPVRIAICRARSSPRWTTRGCVRRSHAPARPRVLPTSRRTTSGTAASRCSSSAARPSRGCRRTWATLAGR